MSHPSQYMITNLFPKHGVSPFLGELLSGCHLSSWLSPDTLPILIVLLIFKFYILGVRVLLCKNVLLLPKPVDKS